MIFAMTGRVTAAVDMHMNRVTGGIFLISARSSDMVCPGLKMMCPELGVGSDTHLDHALDGRLYLSSLPALGPVAKVIGRRICLGFDF
jgi:hypothetical protein